MTTKRKKALGRGLDALFEDMEVSVPIKKDAALSPEAAEAGIKYLELNSIKPNKKQPRKYFDKEGLSDLADSIKAYGVMEPVIVRKAKNGYELVMGERRWRAARLVGLTTIPAIDKDIDDENLAILALIENMQREDLNPFEIAVSLKELMDENELTQKEVAGKINKSRAYVANLLRLLKLPEVIRKYIIEGKISGGHGKALGMIEGEDAQIQMAERVIKEGLSVHDIERLAGETPEGIRKKKPRKRKNRELKQIEDELTTQIGTKVIINSNGSRGKLELYYYSDEELNDLIDLIRKVK